MANLVKTDVWAASRRDDPWMALEWLEQQLSTALQLLVAGTQLELQPELAQPSSSLSSSSSSPSSSIMATADSGYTATITMEPIKLRLRALEVLALAFESSLAAMRGENNNNNSERSSSNGSKNIEETKTKSSSSSSPSYRRSHGSDRMATVILVLRRLMPLVDWPAEVRICKLFYQGFSPSFCFTFSLSRFLCTRTLLASSKSNWLRFKFLFDCSS